MSYGIQPENQLSKRHAPRALQVEGNPRQERSPFLWPVANPLRGRNFTYYAHAFLERFAIGTVLSDTELDAWCAEQGLYVVPEAEDKQSDAWIAMLQRRKRTVHCLNMAATHSRMNEEGSVAYRIQHLRRGWFKVQAPQDCLGDHELTKSLVSLIATKRRQLEYLLQSQDWTELPPHERVMAEALYDDITNFQENHDLQAKHLNDKFLRLSQKMQRAMQDKDTHNQLTLPVG